jgi:N-acetylmuramoyl-L-alanine amidase
MFIVVSAVVLATAFSIMDAENLVTSGSAKMPYTLVIDPGHGGEDGGATCKGKKESEINLAISQKLEALCLFCGVEYVMTRDSEDIDYPDDLKTTSERKVYDQNHRLELINSTENAVLISIHQNKFVSSSPRGPQAFFAKTDGSEELAKLVQASMNTVLYPGNRRIATRIQDSIYLMKNVECPAVLAECGFISNPAEAELLVQDDYQTKLALCLFSSYCIYIQQTIAAGC